MKNLHLPAAFASLALSAGVLFFTSCESEDSDPPYIAVTSGAFFFSPQIDLNKVTVDANTDWRVFWTPAVEGVVVNPASGSGDGEFIVESMPEGVTLQIGVCHGYRGGEIRSNAIRVARASQGDL